MFRLLSVSHLQVFHSFLNHKACLYFYTILLYTTGWKHQTYKTFIIDNLYKLYKITKLKMSWLVVVSKLCIDNIIMTNVSRK
jgi:hypothetical protein